MSFRQLTAFVFSVVLSITVATGFAQAAKVEIIISKVSQKMTVKVDGQTEYVWPVSTGAAGYETPSGSFRPFRLEEDHFSKEWDDAPMPHSIFFTDRGHAIHGSFSVKSLGRRASHGCVRLAPQNAETLFGLVSDAGLGNTRVVLKGGFFDFDSSGRRSFSEVSRDVDNTTRAKPRKPGGFFSLFGQPRKPVVAAKKPVKAKKAVVAKKTDPKKKVQTASAKKPAAKTEKLVEKCTTKDGKKTCKKVAAPKVAQSS
jgi:hypothetical protein